MCFPGGKRDPSDKDDVHTALREAEEEIGLPAGQVEVVCSLFPIINKVRFFFFFLNNGCECLTSRCHTPISVHVVTQSGLLVTTVVGFIDKSFCPSPNQAEVSAVFSVPLDFFTSEENHASSSSVGTLGLMHSFHFLDPGSSNQYHIWGLTAMIAVLVSVLALRKKPEFDVAFDTDDPISSLKKFLHRKLSKL